jgi:hypothetical protein
MAVARKTGCAYDRACDLRRALDLVEAEIKAGEAAYHQADAAYDDAYVAAHAAAACFVAPDAPALEGLPLFAVPVATAAQLLASEIASAA